MKIISGHSVTAMGHSHMVLGLSEGNAYLLDLVVVVQSNDPLAQRAASNGHQGDLAGVEIRQGHNLLQLQENLEGAQFTSDTGKDITDLPFPPTALE